MTLKYRLWLALPQWMRNIWKSPYQEHRMKWLRRTLLWLALGPRTYGYMKKILAQDPRAPRAREIDIVVRKDGMERRIEADWVRSIARILYPNKRNKLEPEPPNPNIATEESYGSATRAEPTG